MLKNLSLICLFLFFMGCGNTLNNSWNNFRAYYNTYYNAEENFRAGLKKLEEQPLNIDPTRPVRIHPAPVQAGNTDFQKAIDKGASILRKFPSSRWADDALFLIGKSYYYRLEFYPALQKFEELQTASGSNKLKQQAIIWKGRTQLDLKLFSESISYLESELNRYPEDWSLKAKAEIQALTGEHHAMLENWEQSADYLSLAVSNIEEKKLLGRSLFLYGQVLERLDRYGEAYFTFSKVSENFPGFEYIFWARFKQADLARKEGNLDQAIGIYEKLRKDDKNFQRRNEISYEIARTYEMKGDVSLAEKKYKELLYEGQSQQRDLKADIYFSLGKIYSDHYNNYSTAAAYFDTSSSISGAPQNIDSENAQSLADAFSQYSGFQKTINRADSLLYLGSLSESQLDSALSQIRVQKRRKFIERQQKESENVLANRGLENAEEQSSSSTVYGFLNHRNAELVNQSKKEFRIVWGNRPLVDNWRRRQAVRQLGVRESDTQTGDLSEQPIEGDGSEIYQMNLEEIPRTDEEKKKLTAERLEAQYELGNLLFLNLGLADSARYYFYKVIKSDVESELQPKAMYSLVELFRSQNSPDSLEYWATRIKKEYPKTRYAERLENRLGGTSGTTIEADTTETLLQRYQQITLTPGYNAGELRNLALENKDKELAPHIYFKAIESYIRKAKEQSAVTDSIEVRSDSMAIESLMFEQNFQGVYWDSVRSAIQEFDITFPNANQQKQLKKLQKMLKQPEEEQTLPSCQELGVSLEVQPSMDQFLETVHYPENLRGMSVSGQVVYSFVVNDKGEVQSYRLVSQNTGLGIEKAFEKAFDETLAFARLNGDDLPENIACEVSFPIRH